MAERLPFYPEIPAHTYEVTLDGEQYTVSLTWIPSRASWYLGLSAADGTALLRGRRLSPYVDALAGVPGAPPGVLTPIGADPYDRYELTLVYVPLEELSLLPPVNEDDGRIVVVS